MYPPIPHPNSQPQRVASNIRTDFAISVGDGGVLGPARKTKCEMAPGTVQEGGGAKNRGLDAVVVLEVLVVESTEQYRTRCWVYVIGFLELWTGSNSTVLRCGTVV
jgi:hypothetical protein